MAGTAPVYVQDHCFFLSDAGADTRFQTMDYATGLAGVMVSTALMYAGIDRGIVTVTVGATDSRPRLDTPRQWAALAEWDDVAEVTLHVPNGDLRVDRLEYGPFDSRVDLPVLSPFGPGHYRVRIHARGRDRCYDKVVENSEEAFYLLAWPQPPAPPLVVKSNSWCGYGLRLGQISKPPTPAAVGRSPEEVEAEARKEMLRRTLGIARPAHTPPNVAGRTVCACIRKYILSDGISRTSFGAPACEITWRTCTPANLSSPIGRPFGLLCPTMAG